eukprot:3953393-Lingulodinium_polyedra.AAC.1
MLGGRNPNDAPFSSIHLAASRPASACTVGSRQPGSRSAPCANSPGCGARLAPLRAWGPLLARG